MLDDNKIKSILENPRDASRNNWVCDCPFCGKEQHFFVKKKTKDVDKYGKNKSYNFDCKKCNESGRIFKLLHKLEKTHLLDKDIVNVNEKLVNELFIEDDGEDIEIEELNDIRLPVGFKRIKQNKYLDKRGFMAEDYKRYNIGTTDLLIKFTNRIIVPVCDKGKTKAYLSRTTLNSKLIDLVNKVRKRNKHKKLLRYENSSSSFSCLLLGIDEINTFTKTVILVEGFFDKVSVDRGLKLFEKDEVKCCVTFGSKISKTQMLKLLMKGVENIIIFFDPDAIDKVKTQIPQLKKFFKIKIGYTGNHEKDLGDLTDKEVMFAFENNLENPTTFFSNKLNIIKLY